MVKDNTLLKETMNIYQIRHQSKRRDQWESNKNYVEPKTSIKKCAHQEIEARRSDRWISQIPMKRVTIELPTMGCERAILQPKRIIKAPKSILKKPPELKEAQTITEDIVQKLTRMQEPLKKANSSKEIRKPASKILEDTDKELKITEDQLTQLKSIIKERKERSKTSRTSTSYKARNTRKMNRHQECLSKKYLTTLSSMQQTLRRLEQKYFQKPKIVYKSVNNTFTQSKSVEVLYENERYPEECKMTDAFKNILTELDELAAGEFEDKSSTPRNLIFKPPVPVHEEGKDEIAKTIELSEKHLKKLGRFKQDIREVESFCDKICNLTQSEDFSDREDSMMTEGKEYWKKQLLESSSFFKGNGHSKYLSEILDTSQDNMRRLSEVRIDEILPIRVKDGLRNRENDKSKPSQDLETIPSILSTPKDRAGFLLNHREFPNSGSYGDQDSLNNNVLRKLAIESAYWIEQLSKKKQNKKFTEVSLPFHREEKQNVDDDKMKYFSQDVNDQVSNLFDKKYLEHLKTGKGERNISTEIYDTCPPKKLDQNDDDLNCIRFPGEPNEKPKPKISLENIQDGINVFENGRIQKSVLGSCFLMKEFNIRPNVKLFNCENQTNKQDDVSNKYSYSVDTKNVDDIINNLNNILENSGSPGYNTEF